ncbi:hypothetical protein D3C71_1592610 [compost metagenome]
MADDQRLLQLQVRHQRRQRGGVGGGIRLADRQRQAAAVAWGVPGQQAMTVGQPRVIELLDPRSRTGTDAVQQHHRATVTRLAPAQGKLPAARLLTLRQAVHQLRFTLDNG